MKNNINFTKKKYASFILLYLWEKYDPIWQDFTVKMVIRSALIVQTKTVKRRPYGVIYCPEIEENDLCKLFLL